jgi:hypothetical protein
MDAIADLQWWLSHLDSWDGSSIIPPSEDWVDPIVLQTDASTSEGAGAVLRALEAPSADGAVTAWYYYPWPADSVYRQWPITALELAAVAIALATWGAQLTGTRIRIHSDSMAVVTNLSRTASSSEINMRILRGIHALAFQHDFHIGFTSHIRGIHNVTADAASRLSSQTQDRLNTLGLTDSRRVQPVIPAWLPSIGTPSSSSRRD